MPPCVGGEPSGQMGQLTALAGRPHQVGDGPGAFAQCGRRESCVVRTLAFRWVWLQIGGGECPQGARGVLPRALLCGVDSWEGRVGSSPGVGSLENDLEFRRKKKDSDIYLCVPSTALGSQ